MIALVEGAERRKTPNEIALGILLAGLTIVFLAVVVTLRPFAEFADRASIATLIALLVSLIPTTIGALLSAIGIAGMDRLVRRNVLALSGRAVEASGDVDVLLLDKTGTITLGNREATEFIPMPGVEEAAWPRWRSSPRSPTRRPRAARSWCSPSSTASASASSTRTTHFVPFTAETRMSGVDLDGSSLRKGAGDAVVDFVGAGGPGAARARSASSTASAARAARRWRWRATARCWASSTSRTSSRTGCATASTSCAAWASAP